jgi:hypothetical protein
MRTLCLALVLLGAGCQKKTPEPDAHALREPPRMPEPTVGHGFVLIEVNPTDGPLPAALQREAGKATQQHLKPFVYIGATWCAPCNAIKHNLDKPIMIDAFKGTYIMKLDFDAWEDKLPGAGLQHEAVPVFFALDASGKPTGRMIDGGAWGNDTPENIAPALKAFFSK